MCSENVTRFCRFKWIHLSEQLEYERAVHSQRLRMEITQARREAQHFSSAVDKGDNLRQLEENVLKRGGLWEKYQRQIAQRQIMNTDETKAENKQKTNALMNVIFAE
jgi:hypothetical protein